MKCFGVDAATGDHVAISFGTVIDLVDSLINPLTDPDHLAPAWIDLQVNGYAGVDYNSPVTSQDEIARSIRVLHSTGTARFFPTVITGGPDDMIGCLRNLANAKSNLPEGGAIEGFHVEGPHICPDDGPRGAHPRRWVRPPDLDEYSRWQEATDGHIRLITLAPEWPNATQYIEKVTQAGVVVSIGHTNASAQQIQDAVSAGATLSTHIGNGAHAMMQRHPNYIWEQLAEDRLSASFIADGIHLGPAFFKVALRAKGVTKSLLVTDASMPACATPGIYKLGEQEVELTADNRVVLAGQTRLAGSALRMDRAIENVMRITGLSLVETLSMANRNPARVGRIGGRMRGLAAGDRADIVAFRYDRATRSIEIQKTIVGGKEVYSA